MDREAVRDVMAGLVVVAAVAVAGAVAIHPPRTETLVGIPITPTPARAGCWRISVDLKNDTTLTIPCTAAPTEGPAP